MNYLIWQNSNGHANKDRLLNVLLMNHSFAEIFEGDNPLHPVGATIRMNRKRYRITRFEKITDDMIEIEVESTTEGVSETA